MDQGSKIADVGRLWRIATGFGKMTWSSGQKQLVPADLADAFSEAVGLYPDYDPALREQARLEGRNSPATGSAGFANKRFAHAACLSCEPLFELTWQWYPYARCCPPQSPAPGFGEKYWSLFGFPSHSL